MTTGNQANGMSYLLVMPSPRPPPPLPPLRFPREDSETDYNYQ
jgi:hypothetical protein